MGLVKPVAKPGWFEIGGNTIYLRSRWEYQYATYLEWLKKQQVIECWEYEPETFWFLQIKRGVRSYKPDFKVFQRDGTHYWVEVKGYMDSKSSTKLRRMNKYYPDERIYVIDKAWFSKNKSQISVIGALSSK